jgi:hypothetical protein
MLPTLSRRTLLSIPLLLLAPAALAAPPTGASNLVIEVDGDIPGFKPAELSAWIAIQMERSDLPWSFTPAKAGAAAPHRVIWQFTTIAGQGRFKGVHFVSAQARLYRYTQHERTMMDQTEIKGGKLDPKFGPFITEMTRELLARSDPRR